MNEPIEILLIEDNPYDVELTLHALHLNNLTNSVHVARDGVEALEFLLGPDGAGPAMAPDAAPRVILLDLKLPRIDGLEVLRKIRDDPRTRLLPVVVLTSSRQEQDIIESYNLGINSYILKPVDFQQFIEAIRTLGMYWLIYNQPPLVPRIPEQQPE